MLKEMYQGEEHTGMGCPGIHCRYLGNRKEILKDLSAIKQGILPDINICNKETDENSKVMNKIKSKNKMDMTDFCPHLGTMTLKSTLYYWTKRVLHLFL